MATEHAQVFQIRQFLGVNRMVNARVIQPGSWRTLKDFYMPTPGRLQQRPGTVEFASKVVLAAPPATDPEGPDDAPVPRGTFDTTLPGDTGWLVEPTNVSPHPVAQIAGTDKWGTVVEDTVVFEISF